MTKRKYFGCKIAQRGEGNAVEFFIFIVSAKDIMQWAGVRRVGEQEKGTQRIIKPAKIRAIKKFLNVNEKNTIPVSVVVAFGPDSAQFASIQPDLSSCFSGIDTRNAVQDKVEWGTMCFEFEENAEEHLRPALIVDGQHRLKAIADLQEDIPILVIALINASPEEQAFQFVVINNKAAKVPTDNVKAIIASINEEELQDRLLKAGVSYGNVSAILSDIDSQESSPFYQLLDWPLNTSRDSSDRILVKLTTIEACLRYIRNQFPALQPDEEEDTQKDIFLAVWRAVKHKYDDLWGTNEKFMSKVNIDALNEFIIDRLAYAWEGDFLDIYEATQVEAQTEIILGSIPQDFWSEEWNIKLQDNAVIRNYIKEDLRMISQTIKAGNKWQVGLKLIG